MSFEVLKRPLGIDLNKRYRKLGEIRKLIAAMKK